MEGTVIDSRFLLERRGGSGSFGTIYRARDTKTGNVVAVKVFHGSDAEYSRFEREAGILATLHHPNVVSYVDHGRLGDGRPYLAMDWLEGCDLATKLATGGALEPIAALRLALRATQGVAAAHAEGILHRDLKPSNIFLVGGDPNDVRVIDFGIAHRDDSVAKLTMTGAIVGTPAYMSPEQARGSNQLSASSDVFGLGCVLFECLAGESPFAGDNARALLANILSGETPRLSSKKASLDAVFDALVARMMAYDPLDRFRDAAATALAISDVLTNAPAARPALAAASVSARPALVRATVLVEGSPSAVTEARAHLERHGGRVRHQDERSVIVTFELGTGAATVRRAAECALEWLETSAASRIAIHSSRGLLVVDTPSAFRSLSDFSGVELANGRVFVDGFTAGLLGQSFELLPESRGAWLAGHRRAGAPSARRPSVGRVRELAALDGVYAEVASEHCARLLVVLGEAGIGKSHLVELAKDRFAASEPKPTILLAQADRPMSASPFEVVRGFVRDRLGQTSGARPVADLLVELQEKGLGEDDVAFLSELTGVETASAAVEGALTDPLALADAYRVAWLAFLEVEVRTRPLVLVIEDLHFSDAASVRLIAAALAELAEHPLLVVATARPDEAREQLGILESSEPETISLPALRRGVAEELVRACIAGVRSDVVDQILSRADGNPLRLLELVRRASSSDAGRVYEHPSLEARIRRLAPDVQRVLRCASVFGVTFGVDGVVAISDAQKHGIDVDEMLRAAVSADVVRPRGGGGLDPSFTFSHGLLQEASYALLSTVDRAAAHERAGRWLSEQAGIDPSVVAWHFERAGDTTLAFEWYAAAARAALVGGAPARALELTTKALACAPEGDALARVSLIRAETAFASADLDEACRAAERTLSLSTGGSHLWLRATAILVNAAGQAGDNDRVQSVAELVANVTPDPTFMHMAAISLCSAANQLLGAGRSEVAKTLLDQSLRMESTDANAMAGRAHVEATLRVIEHDYPSAIDGIERAARYYALGGSLRRSALMKNLGAGVRIFAGDFAGAAAALDLAAPLARRTGADFYARWIRYTRAKMIALTGESADARQALEDVRRELGKSPRIVAGAHLYAALAALRVDDAVWAESEARAALAAHREHSIRAPALAMLARALVLRGQGEESLAAAREAAGIVEAQGGLAEHESVVFLALPEALLSSGDDDGARRSAKVAADRLYRIASRFARPEEREAYLHMIDTHTKTLQLAYRLGVSDAS